MQINPTPTLYNLGGKGYHLELLNKFCPVPEFFVISLVEDKSIDEQVILSSFDELGAEKVSVRSSATCEDGENASFAGMFESVLNVERDNLIDAVNQVIASGTGERVAEYCKLKGITEKPQMRVVVQKMVKSRISGVCITTENEILIEACHGLGEGLVSGSVTPDAYYISRDTFEIKDMHISCQKKMLINHEYERVPFHMANAKKMKDDEILELSKIALNIEKQIGFKSADIEWAYEGEKLYILQAREFVGYE